MSMHSGSSGPLDASGADDDRVEDDRTDSVARIVVTPEYADAEAREVGEKLAALYARRDEAPSLQLADEIVCLKNRMRKGPRLHAGEFLQDGRFRLLSRTHQGSSDEYWKALDRASNELALVRVFHGAWVTDPAAVKAFLSRGDALERLVHPGIGGVVDANRSDEGFVYLATRFYEHGDLASATLDTVDAIQVGIEVAQALKYAHEHGVVHGDLRPVNVLLADDGSAHVVGFTVEPGSVADGATSLFRAPETMEADYVPAPPADVFALGMTAIATLNKGQLPYWVIRDPARLIKSLPISDSARAVLARATDWDLSVRYPNMAALLEDWLSDPDLVAQLAVRALERGRSGVAAAHYEGLLLVQPTRAVEIRTILGDVYISTGAYDRALEHLLVALERTSEVEALFGRLAIVGKHTGQWTRIAESLWNQARARDAGRRVVLRMELARINEQELKDPVAGAETWSQVLADHRLPEQAEIALRALRDLAARREDWSGFVDFTRELLEYVSAEERAKLQYQIGRTYLEKLNDEDKGLAFIELGEAAGYHELDLSNPLQTIRARRGQWRKVIQLMVLQAAAQDIAEASPTLLRAGIIASSVHLEEDAFTVYHALLERAPKHVVALRHVARLHHRARERDRAMRYYERLWDTYKGKDSEEPEASERAADCTAYARLLLEVGRGEEAVERVDEALRLNPNHVPALQLAGQLYLSRGATTRAGEVLDRLLTLFKSVELSPQKIDACLGMGDLAWVQGRLTAAMGWYNRALELDPFSVPGWWGLAKIALSSRGGHPGADRAPWVMATPKRYTAFEGLARLLAGVLDPEAMRGWLELTPLGRAFVEGGATPMRLACSVVDALVRSELVTPELFQRLTSAYPAWREPITELQALWAGGTSASVFPVARSYVWSKRAVPDDFDPTDPRSVLPTELVLPPFAADVLGTAEAWNQLLSGPKPPAPAPFSPTVPPPDPTEVRQTGPVGALVRDGSLWVALHRDQKAAGVGSAPDNALRITDDPALLPHHARLFRQGGRIYVESLEDGRIQVDGEVRKRWRLIGGERVTFGDTRLQYQVFDDESRLPPPSAVLARAAAPGSGALPSLPPTPPASPPSLLPGARAAATPVPSLPPSRSTGSMPPAPPRTAASLPPGSSSSVPPAPPRSAPSLPPGSSSSVPPAPPRSAPSLPPGSASLPPAPPRSAASLPPGTPPRSPASLPPSPSLPPGPSASSRPPGSPPSLPPGARSLPPGPVDATRLLEPTAALKVGDLKHLVDEDDDDESAVSLAQMAEAPGSAPDHEVTVPFSPASDLGGTASDGLPVLLDLPSEEPEGLRPVPATVVHDVTVERDEPSEEEVIEGPNGVGAARVVARTTDDGGDGPKAVRVDDAPPGMPEPAPGAAAEVPAAWLQGTTTDGDDDDEPSEDGPVPDQTTTVFLQRPSAAGEEVDAVPTLVEPPPYVRPPVDGPSQVDSVFGFPPEVKSDDVADLASEPPPAVQPVTGPTAVPVEREALPSSPPEPGRPRGSLEFMSGPDRGRRIEVGERIEVGQSRQCGISIPSDLRLSPVHCRLERTDEGFVLTDEGSANGTVVNGQRVSRFPLHGGEVIMVGRTVLRFRLEKA